jgi:uncharacterized protein YcgI (DUF1989 family)
MKSPQVQGRVVRDEIIPPCEYAAFRAEAGTILRITDVEGKQVTDIAAFNVKELEERLSAENSIIANGTICPTTGHVLYSDDSRATFTIVADTVGRNYLTGAPCSDEANGLRYGVRGARNCRDNLVMAVAPWGITRRQVQGAFAPFLNIVHYPDGRIEIREPTSKPGDYLEVRLEMDLIVAISNCPQTRNPCNGFNPTSVHMLLYDPLLR